MTTNTDSISGGEAMIRSAVANGVDTIFGIPGAQIYPMFDAMKRLEVNTVVTRHEQGAAYMAMGYAKALGKPGTFAVVPGPGVLNTTAALCTAMGTNTPLLCLTGQVPTTFLGTGRGHLHELKDQAGTLKSLIKDALHISDPKDTSAVVNQAFNTMQSGRPGPVSVEMCWDTMAKPHTGIEIGAGNTVIEQPELNNDQLQQAVKALASAKAPMIMCGGGAQHASEEVLALAELLQAPVTALRSGRGVVAEDHPLGVSSVAARELFDEVDVILGVGSRLEMIYMRWRDMGFYEQKPDGGPTLIRIEVDAAELQRFQPDIAVLADAAVACLALCNALADKVSPDKQRVDKIAEAKAITRRAIEKVQPQMAYMDVIREVLPRDGFFVPELSQMGFTSYFGMPIYQPRTYVTEGFQGTLGFGFQTALGVKVACPDRAVISVNGDGGFMFGVQELATAVEYNIGLITLVFNNSAFGNVRRDQMQGYGGRLHGADLVNPDFVKLAESFGAAGYRVNTPQALKPVLAKAIVANKPALIEVVVERGSEVAPWDFIHMANKPW
jgi:acetolactate synthase-1/2/3 large subunit